MANITQKNAIDEIKQIQETHIKETNKKAYALKSDGTPILSGESLVLDGDTGKFKPMVIPTGGHVSEYTTGKVKDHAPEIFGALDNGGTAELVVKTPAGDIAEISDDPLHWHDWKDVTKPSEIPFVLLDNTGVDKANKTIFFHDLVTKTVKVYSIDERTGAFTLLGNLNSVPTEITNARVINLEIDEDIMVLGVHRPTQKLTIYSYDKNTLTTSSPKDISGYKLKFKIGSWYFAEKGSDLVMFKIDHATKTIINEKVSTINTEIGGVASLPVGAYNGNTKGISRASGSHMVYFDWDDATGTASNPITVDLTPNVGKTAKFIDLGSSVMVVGLSKIKWADMQSIVHKIGSHYDLELDIYKHGTDIKIVGHDLADVTKNKDYAEQELGDGVSDDTKPKLIIKH